ncbi:MAG: response regulator [Candidatus Wallbacteria bacterium]|nr:response regulator [Candidatus Wallbacteria bacterium]
MRPTVRFKLLAGGAVTCVAATAIGAFAHHHIVGHAIPLSAKTLTLLALIYGMLLVPLWIAMERWLLRHVRALHESDMAVARGGPLGARIAGELIPNDDIGDTLRNRNAMLERLHEKHSVELAQKIHAELLQRSLTCFAAGDLETGLSIVVQHVCEHLELSGGWVLLRMPSERGYRVLARHGSLPVPPEREAEFFAGQCACVESLAAGKSVDTIRLHRCTRAAGTGLELDIVTVALRDTQLFGVMDVVVPAGFALSDESRSFLERFAGIVGLALSKDWLLGRLEIQQSQLRSLIEHLPEGVCLLDSGQRVVLANPTGNQILDELAPGRRGDLLLRLGERPLEEFLRPREDGIPHEVVSARPTRTLFEIRVNPIRIGALAGGFVLVMRDATSERDAAQRAQQQDRLAAVGQLAAGIAHDFNNLLTGMIGFAELLQADEISDQAREDAARIVKMGRRAAQLVRQILDFSRKSVVQRQPVDLVPFVKETLKMLQRTLPESIAVEASIETARSVTVANLTQMQQVLTNLAVNARDAMPEGGSLSIRLSQARFETTESVPLSGMEPGDWIVLAIRDTGTGIPADVLQHMFEPFFTTKKPGQGTGLGLAQVYGIVRQHGGHVGVVTRVGEGSTFTVYLPAVTAQPEAQAEAEAPVPRGQGETVLLVEDNDEVRVATARLLESLGYQVLGATHGQEALELYVASSDRVAVVLTDVVMPQMGGMDLLRRLRELSPELPVLLMSGYPLGDEDARSAGADGWLEKPTPPGVAARLLRGAIDRKRAS